MSSHFIASFVPTAMPVVAGEVASRVQIAVNKPLLAIVIVLPTLPSPTAETLPSTVRTCGLGAGFGFGQIGPPTTASTAVELAEPTAPAVKPVAGTNVALRLPSTRAWLPRAVAVRKPTSWLPLGVAANPPPRRL